MNNIHWFYRCLRWKSYGFDFSYAHVRRTKRKTSTTSRNHHFQDLAKLSAGIRGLNVAKRLELLEGVTLFLGPKTQHIQDSIERTHSAVQNLGNKPGIQIAAQQKSVILNSNRKLLRLKKLFHDRK